MKRVFIVLVLLSAATIFVPGLREQAAPQARTAAEWAWEHLEGPLSPVINPFRRVRANTQLGEIGRRLVNDRNRGRLRPETDEFTDYIVRNRILPDTLDPWGFPYRLEADTDSLTLISAGPDGVYGTDDDVTQRLHYPWRDTRRTPRFR